MSTNLEFELATLIAESHRNTWKTFKKVKKFASDYGLTSAQVEKWVTPGEPAFVSNLIEYPYAKNRLALVIQKHLKPLGMSDTRPLISGVFIHQKPKVLLKGRKKLIEIGDVLLVRHHFTSKSLEPEGRAVLIQAKSIKGSSTGALKDNEALQFALYSNWARPLVFPFGELDGPPDGAAFWNLSKGVGEPNSTGVYGLVSNEQIVSPTFRCGSGWAVGRARPPSQGTAPSVTASASLPNVYAKLLTGAWGREWSGAPKPDDHWSHFVIQCLEAASGWTYPLQRLGHRPGNQLPRRRDIAGFMAAMAGASGAGFNSPFDSGRSTRMPDRIELSVVAHRLARRWMATLPPEEPSDGDGTIPPKSQDIHAPNRRPPVSVLYIATFGGTPLHEPTSFDEDGPSSTDYPGWGEFSGDS